MPKQFLVRNVPGRTQSWLEQECDRKKVSRNSLILSVLEQARETASGAVSYTHLTLPTSG